MRNITPSSAPVHLDFDHFRRLTGLPYWTWAKLRELRVGQQLQLVDFAAPGIVPKVEGVAAVTVERRRGGTFRMDAMWTAHLGKNAQRRGHLWVWVEFKMQPGRKMELLPDKSATRDDSHLWCLRLIQVVLRRAALLSRWAKRDGDSEAFGALYPGVFMSRYDTEYGALPWLEKLRGPALSTMKAEN
ncbi:hypothetical protein KTD31_01305 [Burkholderia multivorans]|uniref:hypothetical protein n=1 Tax=Burkholderia multivorans TaxID=87883 RepID=UPI001C22397D|nr:hypothetical protein [Burkholderia multivorans]MBU9200039.1 hypothetical protein [Burkholderia multivorans]MDN8078842.1 hypothetical protein [Burkholderia multivorans]